MRKPVICFVLLFGVVLTVNAQVNDIVIPERYSELMKQDWANLARYREENKKLLAMTPYPQSVVFMGNSITEGWMRQHPEYFEKSGYINRGIGGQTTPQMLIRFKPDVLDLRPDVVVILAGTNDIAGNTGFSTIKMITDNISSMAQLAKTNGIQVIISSVLPVADYPWRKGLNPAQKIIDLNQWLKNYANDNDFIYLNYFSAMVNDQNGLDSEYSEDGVHPNSKGYEVMEPLADEAIKKALGEK